jgi:hypothetical protein
VGLYLNPPENAIVLCMDEKSQIQALDRTQPSLPIKPGRAGTMRDRPPLLAREGVTNPARWEPPVQRPESEAGL